MPLVQISSLQSLLWSKLPRPYRLVALFPTPASSGLRIAGAVGHGRQTGVGHTKSLVGFVPAASARRYYRLAPQVVVVPVSRTYRCLNCMDSTVTRSYDVSHITRTCEVCGEFERHVNQRVIDQYEAFEADPPTALDWDALDRTRKLVVAERVTRQGRSVESLAPDRDDRAAEAEETVTPTDGDERAVTIDASDEEGDDETPDGDAADTDTSTGGPTPAETDSSPSGSG
jgi:hypothetical protein